MTQHTTPRSSREVADFVDSLIGEPWTREQRHCWRLVREVAAFMGYTLPPLVEAAPPGRRERAALFSRHVSEEWVSREWRETTDPSSWAVALMHRASDKRRLTEHCGVYLPMIDGGGVLHCDQPQGVCFDTLLDLQQVRHWTPIFLVPTE